MIGSPTDVDAFADVIAMPNPTGDATSEAEINHAFNELNNLLNEEGMNSVDLPMGRGPLASMASATSSVSSSSLTALKTQGYSTVPIKDIGINPLKSTSYYVVDLTNAPLETLETMDRDADVVICLEDEAWMRKASIEWLFNEGIQDKYNFRGTQTSWVKDKAGINSSYGLYDSYLFESSNECEMENLMDADGDPQEMGSGYPRSQDLGHDSGPTTNSSQGLVSGSDLNNSSLFSMENQEERQDQTQQTIMSSSSQMSTTVFDQHEESSQDEKAGKRNSQMHSLDSTLTKNLSMMDECDGTHMQVEGSDKEENPGGVRTSDEMMT